MLKGHVFKNQFFKSHVFASFINTFLGGRNGVDSNFKNAMSITYSGNNLTIQSGIACIQGRFVEEESNSDVPAGTDNAYCKLVIEIDLDKENTESNFLQGSYKVVKATSTYPKLTQTNIVKNNSGIYQYELARFRTSSSGITGFTDMRTFLDFETLYDAMQREYREVLEELKKELQSAKDSSTYFLRNELYRANLPHAFGSESAYISYPEGFNKNNTIIICVQYKYQNRWFLDSDTFSLFKEIALADSGINISFNTGSYVPDADEISITIIKKISDEVG